MVGSKKRSLKTAKVCRINVNQHVNIPFTYLNTLNDSDSNYITYEMAFSSLLPFVPFYTVRFHCGLYKITIANFIFSVVNKFDERVLNIRHTRIQQGEFNFTCIRTVVIIQKICFKNVLIRPHLSGHGFEKSTSSFYSQMVNFSNVYLVKVPGTN